MPYNSVVNLGIVVWVLKHTVRLMCVKETTTPIHLSSFTQQFSNQGLAARQNVDADVLKADNF